MVDDDAVSIGSDKMNIEDDQSSDEEEQVDFEALRKQVRRELVQEEAEEVEAMSETKAALVDEDHAALVLQAAHRGHAARVNRPRGTRSHLLTGVRPPWTCTACAHNTGRSSVPSYCSNSGAVASCHPGRSGSLRRD